ncbi:hypothetical protein BKA82DRAFT_3985600 [Pisolithus tinctorius]|nr:hypothetical protein BKA82DRAFT_3985600 [Pisolithus tinctorius]
MGYFPSAPLGPTLAVSLQLLSLVRQVFMHMPPNISAWCESLEAYLASMGYKVDTKEGICQRFSNAYHWYCILEISVNEYVQQHLESAATPPADILPAVPSSSHHPPDVSSSRTWPSEYLQKHCPLYFGSHNWKNNNSSSDPDTIVCIDACFTQKHRRSQQDDPVNPTGSVFLSQEDIDTMECEVEGLRRTKASVQKRSGQSSMKNCGDEDRFEQGMRIPPSVLKGCNESFTAADERCQEASTQFFSDTGVMALLCHHDHVIHLANMTSAGEKQHYALALIKSLFSHLPDDFHIGLLYDIDCQLEQSCRKWGYLGLFLP